MRKEIIEIHDGKEYYGEILIELNKSNGHPINPQYFHILNGFVDGICVYARQIGGADNLLDYIPLAESLVRAELVRRIEMLTKNSIESKLKDLGFKETTNESTENTGGTSEGIREDES